MFTLRNPCPAVKRRFLNLLFAGFSAFFIIACGGGGGDVDPVAFVQSSPAPPGFAVTCSNGALAISTVSATDTSVCPTIAATTPPATVTVVVGTQTSSTPTLTQQTTTTFVYGSLAITGHRDTNEFNPCFLNNVQNSLLVYSCRSGNDSYFMSFSFANDVQGKAQLSWVTGANSSLYNNYYGSQFPTNNRTLRRITFNNVSLDFAASTGTAAGLPSKIVVNGTLSY